MDIEGFGIRIGDQLVHEGLLNDIADIYFLEREQLLALEGFADKKVDNLLNAIEASKAQSFARFLTGLGIRYVGSVVAGLLVNSFPSIDILQSTTQTELEAVDGVGPRIAESMVEWFSRPPNQILIDKFRRAGLTLTATAQPAGDVSDQPLAGLTFVVTGTLPTWSREEAKSFIEQHGGKVTGSVSQKTDYLLVGEKAGSKLTKAKNLGIPILDEDAVRQLVDA
jgi:DNA ligase (NAD+)